MTGNKFVVVHGHFYQPPRENPWLDIIEEQESAAPYHDWNERIYDECYRPNAYSRLLDSQGAITGIHNNYTNMSFNFGPTLFSWLERYHPVTAQKIIAADKLSSEKLGGHGNAVAQVFNHIIMPLAPRRDQLTQIRWAKHFFKKRHGRDPEGIWLGETAINMITVQCLIEEKIRYVILAPSQAESFRHLDSDQWVQTKDQGVDTRRPYRIFPRNESGEQLPGHLDLFFFDEGLSKEISFN
ncbi:MAG: glycoside hydrolase, partial [Fibrobacterota bacterium]